MKFKAMILVSGTLALAACGHKADTGNADMANADMTNMAVDNGMAANTTEAASPLTSQGFANAAAASDRFEIESSKLAQTTSKSAAIKAFADKMITAHTASTAKLKTTAAGMSPAMTPDDTLSADQQSALDGLKGKTGADFDTAYAAAQVDGHQKTLDALNAYVASGDNATLKTFATGLIPTVTAHLNMAKGLK
jgi:putative membrane protein